MATIFVLTACNDELEKKEPVKENDVESKQEDETKQKDKPEAEEDEGTEIEEVEDDKSVDDTSTWDDMKEMDNIIGKSDKDFSDIMKKAKPSDVRNDKTGNWKKLTLAENFNIEEYALSYKDTYIEDGEIHFIINFNNKTTTRISSDLGLTYVTIHEYVDKEEHDAAKMPSGMVLKDYIIYPDGDIEEIK